jgi:hypothetical protein
MKTVADPGSRATFNLVAASTLSAEVCVGCRAGTLTG